MPLPAHTHTTAAQVGAPPLQSAAVELAYLPCRAVPTNKTQTLPIMPPTAITHNQLTQHRFHNNQSLTNAKVADILQNARKEKTQFLDLSRNRFTQLNLTGIPPLPDVTVLDLSYNQEKLEEVVLSGAVFPHLKYLYLHESQIQKIALQGSFPHLKAINLANNNLQEFGLPNVAGFLEIESINLEGNKQLGNPPPEIVSQGLEAMLRHWERLQKSATQKLNEAKLLIVGEARVGKTSLLKKLLDITNDLPTEDLSTRGIDVLDYPFTYNGEKYTIHFWDFGGQQIYRSTHNLFLTNRSFYLLVDDSSRDDTRLDYWLQKIERLAGPETPTFLVQNQRHNRSKQIDEDGLWGRFSQLRHAAKPYKLDLSCEKQEDKDTLKDLQSEIENKIAKMPIVGTALPENWVRVRERLADMEKKSAFISQQELHTICSECNITQYEELKDLSQLFHDLGVFLHFHEDAVLKHLVILQKEWATDAIYFVLDDPILTNNNKGHFCREDVMRIWRESDETQRQKHPNHASYLNSIDELIELMVKFELCYERQDQAGEYIIPQMLPVSTPKYDWGEGEEIQLYYDYGAFMPEGILHRLIVRTHQYITNLNEAWARGCILYDTESATTKAEIIEPYAENRITLRAKGSQAKTLLSFATRQLDSINRSYGKDGLKPKKWVPCICPTCKKLVATKQKPHFYDYDDLLRRKEKGKETVECSVSYILVSVARLIEDVFGANYSKPQSLKIFISYSKADESYKKELETHLGVFKQQGLISTWSDRELQAGEEWDKKIKQELMTADIILFLVSSNFINTKYIWDIEMKQAMNRHDRGEARIVPIIIRSCLWDTTPFAKLNVLPNKGMPVNKYKRKDEAWTEIAQKLEEIITVFGNLKLI